MKKLNLAMFLCLAGIAFANGLSSKSTLVIDNIQIGKMDGDNQANQFSILMNLHNTGNEIANWQLGFYMPRSFYSIASLNINPDLLMQICDVDGGCANLRYIKADSIYNADTSQGYFTMLEPLAPFSFKKNANYILKLLHSNQWPVTNISALPQSWFITIKGQIKNEIPVIQLLNTELTQYTLLNYNHQQVESQLNAYLAKNWQQAQIANITKVNLIPTPVSLQVSNDQGFTIPTKTLTIHNQLNIDNAVADFWAAQLKTNWKIKKKVLVDNEPNVSAGIIITSPNDPRVINNNPEGYRLTITSSNITIETLTNAGAYYALQSLNQLYWQNKQTLPALVISDYPRFKYRGVLLDVARHYFSVNEIKNLIDIMAAQKLNTLHIHFADDEAFRLNLAAMPTLTTIGTTRGLGQAIGANMLLQNNLDTTNLTQQIYPYANSVYAGSYSALDIQSLITYANLNQITIIPEIDLPGHARALIKALPEAMYDPNDNSQFMSVQGYTDNVIPVCTYNNDISVGNQFTQTTNNLLMAITDLFKQQTTIYALSNEISLGGDEVSAYAWSNDTSCKGKWSNLTALEKSHLFFQQVALQNPNLLISGWQQLVQTDEVSLGKNIVPIEQAGHIWVWSPSTTGIKQAAELANKNYPTILAYADKLYFDLAYTPSFYELGFTWAGTNIDTYSALSTAQLATQTQQLTKNPQNILGLEGALWSENLASYDHLAYMALPKMVGLAEAAWAPESITLKKNQLNWQDLAQAMGCENEGFLGYLNQQYGVNYRGYPHGISLELPSLVCNNKTK